MKGFMFGNGFDSVIDQSKFENPTFVGPWGVSDEDVLMQIHKQLSDSSKYPKFLAMLSTSNHEPFDFPVDVSTNYSQPLASRENAIRYADYALGKFFAQAMQKDYWENTIFLVVADHDLRVSDFLIKEDPNNSAKTIKLFSVEGFHIPGLILGGGISPKQIDCLTSQIDLPPTLLGLLGINADHPMIGTDITIVDDNYVGRAIMQFNDYQAYLEGDSLVVLRPGKPPLKGKYNNNNFTPMNDTNLEILAETALAHALWANLMYKNRSYN